MNDKPSDPADRSDASSQESRSSSTRRERVVSLVVIGLVLSSALWALRTEDRPPRTSSSSAGPSGSTVVLPEEKVPLVTGDETIHEIFIRAGCVVCHQIPGIPEAKGRVGPPLALGSTGKRRLGDPAYRGKARTVHEYVIESVLEPDRFVVPGYPSRTMPAWYGSKLSALALEKIARYLEQQTGDDGE
ncbi:conserved protein of unknown function [Candidatus Nitrospira inopinata]|jgi:hypothetical protein|uniref:Cytochrome c domain-containing protein n=1 Tax=Candidatus Nitrospira inopinata TaxID=1715989 RepID=A0A0S4KTC1_9BACT|nr:conserved protein of unknown function [Candidatus Nitrospira inopinata]